MTQLQGLVQHVETQPAASFAEADAAISDTVVYVAQTAAFLTESGTCTVDIAGVEYTATPDSDTSSLTLSPALSVAVAEGDLISLTPAAEIKWAFVVFDGDDSGDWIQCRVPHELVSYSKFEDGPREVGGREAVLVETEPEPFIVTMVNQPALFDGSFIDPESTIPPAALTDGLAPASSPTPTLEQFAVGGLKWSVSPVANADPVKFRVYADTVDPPTVDAAHLVYDGSALSGSFASINGVALLPSDPSVAPDPVYVACIEYDADGDAAVSATSAPATPRRAGVPEISADWVYAGNVQANQVTAGELLADYVLAGKITAAGGLLEIGDDGTITIYSAATGNPLIQLSPDGSVFRGRVEADDVSVLNGLVLQGVLSHIAQDAVLTIDGSIGDPGAAPTLANILGTQQALAQPTAGYNVFGMSWDSVDGCWLRLEATAGFSSVKIRKIDTSGTVIGTVTLDTSGLVDPVYGWPMSAVYGVQRLGSHYFATFLTSSSTLCVGKWNTSGARIATASKGTVTAARRAAIGTDGTDLILAFGGTDPGTPTTIMGVNPSTLATVGALAAESSVDCGSLVWVGRDNFDLGANRIVIASTTTAYAFTLSGTTLTEVTAEHWTAPSSRGFAWNGTNFVSNNGASFLYKYGDYYPAASEKAYVAYQDTDGTDHTKVSPIAEIALENRKYVSVSLPPAPTGATDPDIYATLATSTPAVSALDLRSETITSRASVMDPATAGGAAPTDTNTFGAGTPGKIQSEIGGFEVHGDGTGAWPLQQITWTKARKTAAQTTATGTAETLGQSGELYGAFDGSGTNGDTAFWTESNGVFTILVDGVYDLSCWVEWASNSTGYRLIGIALNGSTTLVGDTRNAVTGQVTRQSISPAGGVALTAGNTVELLVLQNSGGNLNVNSGSWFTISRRGALAA
jgi:hypothetical protein